MREPRVDPFSTHLPALAWALESFRQVAVDYGVLEQGAGLYSTPFLRAWCEAAGANLTTVEPDRVWRRRFPGALPGPALPAGPHGVVLLDGDLPGERAAAIASLRGNAKCLVVHDWRPRPGPRQIETYGDMESALRAWPNRKNFTETRPYTVVVWE